MTDIILRTNATAVYRFLSFIQSKLPPGETLQRKKILDCGAGGPVPPLALFHQHGLDAWGIEISGDQIARAAAFCKQNRIQLRLHSGDMRALPFKDQSFDYVYENYAMCHLSKPDTAQTMREIFRVVAPGGYALVGMISTDTWPHSMFGQEREPGEYWGEEAGRENTLHSLFTDREADALVSALEILEKEKYVTSLRDYAEGLSMEAWMDLYAEAGHTETEETWQRLFSQRMHFVQYAHIYYLLKKPAS